MSWACISIKFGSFKLVLKTALFEMKSYHFHLINICQNTSKSYRYAEGSFFQYILNTALVKIECLISQRCLTLQFVVNNQCQIASS